jgi:hypothetical protein
MPLRGFFSNHLKACIIVSFQSHAIEEETRFAQYSAITRILGSEFWAVAVH